MIKLIEWQYYPKWHIGLDRNRNDYKGFWWYEYWFYIGPLQFRFRGPSKNILCEKCDEHCFEPEDDYGEFICKECRSNMEEAAYIRDQEDFHDGGSTRFKSLLDQQIEARKLK